MYISARKFRFTGWKSKNTGFDKGNKIPEREIKLIFNIAERTIYFVF